MEHELFRYLSPGICFITPIYLAACWAVLNSERGDSLKEFILIGGSATVPALAIPFGWYVYNCFRAFRHLMTTSYEEKPFVKVIRESLTVIRDPGRHCYYVNFSCINRDIGWRVFSESAFHLVFYPFRKGRKKRMRELRRGRCTLGYLEPVSDLLLFPNSTYDYARSIASVRYGVDSSVFAFGYGLVLGLSTLGIISYHVDEPPFAAFNRVHPYFWYTLFLLPFISLAALAVLRREQAADEYSSRLTLITMISSEATRVRTEQSDSDLPEPLRLGVERLPAEGRRYAAFDLDNTLLVGDVGEALFAQLLREGRIAGPGWRRYQQRLKEDRRDAYISIVEAMKGLRVEDASAAAERVVLSGESFIEVEGERVPVPRPNPLMQSLVVALRLRGVEVYVVTASSQVAAEVAAWTFFGIPSQNVLGIKSEVRDEGPGGPSLSSVVEPVPFSDGKVAVLKERLGATRPYLTAGDSQQDVPMLQYTRDDGLILWVDDSEAGHVSVKEAALRDRNTLFIEREAV